MLFDAFATRRRRRLVGIAIALAPPTPRVAQIANGFDHVEGPVFTDDDVFAARIEGVALFDGDEAVAVIADHFETAHDAPAVEVAVVQAIFCTYVVLSAVEFGFAEKLAGEEARAFEAFQAQAGRAATGAGMLVRCFLFGMSQRHIPSNYCLRKMVNQLTNRPPSVPFPVGQRCLAPNAVIEPGPIRPGPR